MSITRGSRAVRRAVLARRLGAGLLTIALLGAAGCGRPADVGPAPAPAPAQAAPGVAGVTGLPVPPDLATSFTRLLDQRARAVLAGDRPAFAAGLDDASSSFVAEQQVYYDNLRQLPLAAFGYRLVPASLVRTGTSYWVVVEVTTQLRGFDAVPVTAPDRFKFSPTRHRGHYRLSSTTDTAWEAANHVAGQPWDRGAVQVRLLPGVMGVFDRGTVASADTLMPAVQAGAADVRARVPYAWSGTVVFYALSDESFFARLGRVPGGDPQHLDGVAFTVPASAEDPTVAAVRVVLDRSVLAAAPVARDRLIRHELTHVAVGDHDAHAPVWLSEGLAEWTSVQALPVAERRVPASALAAVERPPVRMPTDAAFEAADPEVDYALAWWSCEFLAEKLGASTPWVLLDALEAPHARPRSVTRQITGLTPDALARHAARLMAATYDPSPPPAAASPTAPASPGLSPGVAPGVSPGASPGVPPTPPSSAGPGPN